MENNFYDMTTVSKKTLERNKKIEKNINESLNSYYTKLRDNEAEKERKLNEAAMSGARFGYASKFARSKNKVNSLNEEIRYQNDSSIAGMTEMIAEVVESALLLDESEFVKYNPDYKDDIRDIISGFLKEGNINEEINDPRTLQLMEYVARTLPSTKEGVNLTEDELANHIASNKNRDVELAIKNLSGDVSSRVASLVEAEQDKVEKINKEVNKAKKPEKTKEKEDSADADEILKGLESGKISQDDVDEALSNGEISQDVYDNVMEALSGANQTEAEMPVDEDESEEDEMPQNDDSMENEEEMPVDENGQPIKDDYGTEEHQTNIVPGQPKKQIQMLPDGTLNVNIYESHRPTFVHETPRCGLIESLAVNEAANMLKEGMTYDSDTCLANAIMYVTITEAMDEMGLMNVGKNEYAKIISAAGGNNNIIESGMRMKSSETVIDGLKRNDIVTDKNKNPINGKTKLGDLPSNIGKKVDNYNKKHSTALSEGVICSQEAPRMNTSSTMDLAERIRAKKLAAQQYSLQEGIPNVQKIRDIASNFSDQTERIYPASYSNARKNLTNYERVDRAVAAGKGIKFHYGSNDNSNSTKKSDTKSKKGKKNKK